MRSVEVGQLYIDKMFRSEMEVRKVNEKGVWLKDTEPAANTLMSEFGSIYVWDTWEDGIQATRFMRVDQFLLEDDDTDIEKPDESESEEESEPELEPEPEPEQSEEEEEEPESELTADSFGNQEPLSW